MMATEHTTIPLLARLLECADTTAYGQFRDALRSRHAPAYELAPALAQMLQEAQTPRHAKLACWLLQDLATYRPDAFVQCLGMEYAGIAVEPEAFTDWQTWMAMGMAAQTPAACIMRDREDAAYFERHKHEATDYDAEDAFCFEWERDAGNNNRWTMALRLK